MHILRRIAALALPLLLPCAAAGADEPSAVDVSAMPVAERSALAPATIVKLPTGQLLPVSVLLAEHAARIARLRASVLPAAPAPAARAPVGADFIYLGGGNFVVKALRTPPPGPPHHPRLDLVPATYGGKGYAAAYLTFCARAAATVCLYRPGPSVFALNFPATGLMSDIDPFLLGRGCTGAGGSENDGFCLFTYPMSATARFAPGDPPSAQREGTCATDYIGKIEPRGIVTIAFDPKSFDTDASENVTFRQPSFCVIRIYAPASAPAPHA